MQPCSQPRYGLIERSKPISGESLRAMIVRVASTLSIVADGGSEDDTVAIASATGARIVAASRGRGTQLAAGAAAASGDWLLFLHADCRVLPGWEAAVETFLAAPGAAGRAGYFMLALD